jgi:hypothetical protein
MVEGNPELLKFAANYEQYRPQGDFDQVSREQNENRQCNDGNIDSEARARTTDSFLTTNEVYGRARGEGVDEDRKYDCDGASRQGNQNRDLRGMGHPSANLPCHIALLRSITTMSYPMTVLEDSSGSRRELNRR